MKTLDHSIKKVAKFIYFLFFVLILQLTYLQVIDADSLENNPKNTRTIINKFTKPRGDIITQDKVTVAESIPSDDEWKYQRIYPTGDLFGHITGFQSFRFGNTGVEDSYNKDLQGKRGQEENVPRVFLTLNSEIQQLLKDQLANEKGSIVVMEAKTGAIVGMYSNPSFDPSPLATHNQYAAQESFSNLNSDPLKPSLSRSFAERYAPGSTFKIVTTSAALETGVADDNYKFGALNFFDLPNSDKNIRNYGGGSCGGTLQRAFQQSCNVVFASLADTMGDRFTPEMEKFGIGGIFNGTQNVGPIPGLDIDGAVGATGTVENSYKKNAPSFGNAGIGQGIISLSPLSVTLMTSAIATGGTIPTPHVVDYTENGSGTVLRRIRPNPFKQNVVTPDVAEKVKSFMVDVVNKGTGSRAKTDGLTIAGKTGTAEVDGFVNANVWFTSFAPAEDPKYVITVFLETSKSNRKDATGGQLSAPIAKTIYEKLFNLK
jgi:peptidoglycan glycosyltransferase